MRNSSFLSHRSATSPIRATRRASLVPPLPVQIKITNEEDAINRWRLGDSLRKCDTLPPSHRSSCTNHKQNRYKEKWGNQSVSSEMTRCRRHRYSYSKSEIKCPHRENSPSSLSKRCNMPSPRSAISRSRPTRNKCGHGLDGTIIEYHQIDYPCFDENCLRRGAKISHAPSGFCCRCNCHEKKNTMTSAAAATENNKINPLATPAESYLQSQPGAITTTTTYQTVTYPTTGVTAGMNNNGTVMTNGIMTAPFMALPTTPQPIIIPSQIGHPMMTTPIMAQPSTMQFGGELLSQGGTLHTLSGVPVVVPVALKERERALMM